MAIEAIKGIYMFIDDNLIDQLLNIGSNSAQSKSKTASGASDDLFNVIRQGQSDLDGFTVAYHEFKLSLIDLKEQLTNNQKYLSQKELPSESLRKESIMTQWLTVGNLLTPGEVAAVLTPFIRISYWDDRLLVKTIASTAIVCAQEFKGAMTRSKGWVPTPLIIDQALLSHYTDKTTRYQSQVKGVSGYLYQHALPGSVNRVLYLPADTTDDPDKVKCIKSAIHYHENPKSVAISSEPKALIQWTQLGLAIISYLEAAHESIDELVALRQLGLKKCQEIIEQFESLRLNDDKVIQNLYDFSYYIANLNQASEQLLINSNPDLFRYILKILVAMASATSKPTQSLI